MDEAFRRSKTLIGVTGAHGVGKTTLSARLAELLKGTKSGHALLLNGLGDAVRARGIEVGSSATDDGIAAIFAAHLNRERCAPSGIILLDRCAIDAIAYARYLTEKGSLRASLYEEIGQYQASHLSGIIHCSLSPFFKDKGKSHETLELREFVAQTVEGLVLQSSAPSITLDASQEDAPNAAMAFLDKIAAEHFSPR